MDHGEVRFWLDDHLVEARLPGTTTLLRYLRDHLGRTGTKEGCAEGDCGACAVAILEDRPGREAAWRAVCSCLLFLPMVHGKRVYTVAGLRSRGVDASRGAGAPDGLHPAQVAMVQHRGSQCGYCTPGIVLSLFEACYRDDRVDEDAIDDQLAGNLCRCTGYRPIREAGRAVAGLRPPDRFLAQAREHRPSGFALELGDARRRYLQPATLDALFAARAATPDAVIVAGGTDLALEVTKRHRELPVVIGLEAIDALRRITTDERGWEIGATVTLTRLGEELGDALPALRKHLRVFGSRLIRSRATVGGNLVNASPIGDLAPLLVALGATAVIVGPEGRREVPLEAFFTGYRRTALQGAEILGAVRVPRPDPRAHVGAYKVSKRRELDISTVAAGMCARIVEGRVEAIVLSYGGVAAIPAARALRTEDALRGGPWTLDAVQEASAHLADDFRPIDDLRGSARYRSLLARNLLIGFFLEATTAADPRAPWPVQLETP